MSYRFLVAMLLTGLVLESSTFIKYTKDNSCVLVRQLTVTMLYPCANSINDDVYYMHEHDLCFMSTNLVK